MPNEGRHVRYGSPLGQPRYRLVLHGHGLNAGRPSCRSVYDGSTTHVCKNTDMWLVMCLSLAFGLLHLIDFDMQPAFAH